MIFGSEGGKPWATTPCLYVRGLSLLTSTVMSVAESSSGRLRRWADWATHPWWLELRWRSSKLTMRIITHRVLWNSPAEFRHVPAMCVPSSVQAASSNSRISSFKAVAGLREERGGEAPSNAELLEFQDLSTSLSFLARHSTASHTAVILVSGCVACHIEGSPSLCEKHIIKSKKARQNSCCMFLLGHVGTLRIIFSCVWLKSFAVGENRWRCWSLLLVAARWHCSWV